MVSRRSEQVATLKSLAPVIGRRDRLSVWLSRLPTVIRSSLLPTVTIEACSWYGIVAVKQIHEMWTLFTEDRVVKIPTSDAARIRLASGRDAMKVALALPQCLQTYFVLPNFEEHVGELVSWSERFDSAAPFRMLRDEATRLDQFLQEYFFAVLRNSSFGGAGDKGVEHGDLHVLNLVASRAGAIRMIDLDGMKADGHPFLDLIHFLVHMESVLVCRTFPSLLEQLCEDFLFPVKIAQERNFPRCARLYEEMFEERYIALYIRRCKSWLDTHSSQNHDSNVSANAKSRRAV